MAKRQATDNLMPDVMTKQQVLDAIAELRREMNAGMAATNAGVAAMQQRLERIENAVDPRRQAVFFENSLAITDTTAIVPIPRVIDNQLPPNFPATRGAMRALTGAQADALLHFYGLPVNGTVTERRRRLAMYCHVCIL